MNLVVIDYGSGNLRSVENAFKNSVRINKLNFTIQVTNELELISRADHLVLPGVGSFPDCKKGLEDIKGLVNLLTDEVINNRKKFLGICVGMQLTAVSAWQGSNEIDCLRPFSEEKEHNLNKENEYWKLSTINQWITFRSGTKLDYQDRQVPSQKAVNVFREA